jgi:hypothetical protein
MFNNLGRVITTMFIWGVSLVLSVMSFYMWDEAGLPPIITMIIIIVVLALTTHTTGIIWKNSGSERQRPTVQIPVNIQRQSKAKRSTSSARMPSLRDEKLALLYELMDDDERRAFKRALQDEYLDQRSRSKSLSNLIDGELPFDDPYFEDDNEDYRRL